ncbi:hypothetical protein LY28_00984 [Ruminiclostridium sufflavum DSM 19573]|uniref:Uncharacterized protein n=1 Tax=Ruminiclostridium sufflavum DSM 19573 TaxID=1121337 RepID=A0A318XSE0_9FIRM|nr:hypothetical protein [Ruminiclostridium sufflavum]PYG89161.1 hypothetical protein LY28_00984 [Ruminiclostridium sufflavum DSM 19573]
MNNIQNILGLSASESIKKTLLLLTGWTSAVLALFIFPFVFGMMGVICGILATKNNRSRIGIYLVVSSIVLMGVGLALNARIMPGI